MTFYALRNLLIGFLLLAAAGCASSPSKSPEKAQQFDKVSRWMNREEVHQTIGPPQKITDDGQEQWVAADGKRHAVLLIRFGPDGKNLEMEKNYHSP